MGSEMRWMDCLRKLRRRCIPQKAILYEGLAVVKYILGAGDTRLFAIANPWGSLVARLRNGQAILRGIQLMPDGRMAFPGAG